MDKLLYALDRIDELERKLDRISSNINISLPCRECSVELASNDLSLGVSFESISFKSESSKNVIVMVMADILAESDDEFLFEMSYDGFAVLSEVKNLTSGVHSVFFMKEIDVVSETQKPFVMTITPAGEHAHEIDNIKYYIWGEANAGERKISLSASELNSKLAVSMVLDGRMLVAEYNTIPSEIKLSDFEFFKPAISGGVELAEINNEIVLGYFRIVSGETNLLYAGIKGSGSEFQVDSSVTASSITRGVEDEKVTLIYYSASAGKLKFCNFYENIGQKYEINADFNGIPSKISIIKNFGMRLVLFIVTEKACFLIRTIKEKNVGTDNIGVSINFSV